MGRERPQFSTLTYLEDRLTPTGFQWAANGPSSAHNEMERRRKLHAHIKVSMGRERPQFSTGRFRQRQPRWQGFQWAANGPSSAQRFLKRMSRSRLQGGFNGPRTAPVQHTFRSGTRQRLGWLRFNGPRTAPVQHCFRVSRLRIRRMAFQWAANGPSSARNFRSLNSCAAPCAAPSRRFQWAANGPSSAR